MTREKEPGAKEYFLATFGFAVLVMGQSSANYFADKIGLDAGPLGNTIGLLVSLLIFSIGCFIILKLISKRIRKFLSRGKTFKRQLWGYVKKHHLTIITMIITILFLGLVANQAVQPLISPRLSTFTISEPLYIQSYGDEFTYYKIFKASYQIEPAMFSITNPQILKIGLPGEYNSRFSEEISLMQNMRQSNIYVNAFSDVDLEPYNGLNFVPVSIIDYELDIEIFTDGLSTRYLITDLYFGEKLDIRTVGPSAASSKGYSTSTISPENPVIIEEYYTHEEKCVKYGDREFTIKNKVIRNRNSLEIREYWLDVFLFNKPMTVCDGSVELNTRYDKYVALDLKPLEEKSLILIYEYTEQDCLGKEIYPETLWCEDVEDVLSK